MSSDIGEKARAVFLAALMVLSVVAMTTAFAGSAVADLETTPTDEVIVDDDGGGDHTSIQEALNETGDGTLITVRDGTYNESLTISSSNVTIQGAGVGQSVIQGAEVQLGGGDSRTAAVVVGSTYTENPVSVENVSISGFTIHQNTTNKGVLRTTGGAAQANLTIEDNRFVANGTTSGYGLYTPNAQNVRVADNTFAVEGSGAIEHLATASDSEGIVVEGNTFEGDITRSGEGNAVEVRGTDFTVQNNDFSAVSTDGAIVADINDNLDLAAVLSSNTFDKTVTVEDSSGTLTSGIYGSIQPGVDAASSGDTVTVGPGIYNETVTIDTKNITLTGSEGVQPLINSTALATSSGDSGIELTADNVTVNNLEIIGDQETYNFGVRLLGGLEGVEITNNNISGFYEQVELESTSTHHSDVLIKNNELSGKIGVMAFDTDNTTVESNTIEDSEWGVVFWAASDSTPLINNEIVGNTITNSSVGPRAAISLSTKDTVVANNDLSEGSYGITIVDEIAGSAVDDVSGNQIHQNNIEGYSEYGLATGNISNSALFDGPKSIDPVVNATSNWWGATDGPSGDNFNGHGAKVSGQVTVDPATVSADEVTLQKDFLGIVKDDANTLTVTDNDVANIQAGGEVVNGTLVIEIADTEYVFEDAIQNGKITETDSSNSPSEISPSASTGEADINVVGNDSKVAEKDVGTVDLVHEALDLSKGWNLKSVPQPATLHEQGVESVNQWNPSEASYESGIPEGELSDAESLHRGMYVEAEDDSARLGYEFATDDVPAPSQIEMENGWHLVSSNYDIDTQVDRGGQRSFDTRQLQTDLTNIDAGGPGVTVFADDQSHQLNTGSEIGAFETYWVFIDSPERNDRGLVTPTYNPSERESLLVK